MRSAAPGLRPRRAPPRWRAPDWNVASTVDLAHSTGAESINDLVRANALTRGETHACGGDYSVASRDDSCGLRLRPRRRLAWSASQPIQLEFPASRSSRPVLGGRSTVGHGALDAVIGVRIPASQPLTPQHTKFVDGSALRSSISAGLDVCPGDQQAAYRQQLHDCVEFGSSTASLIRADGRARTRERSSARPVGEVIDVAPPRLVVTTTCRFMASWPSPSLACTRRRSRA